ncbi:lysophospholipid acyltransferase [Borealophlyctis nickersoniae]|nr:lysophospholipid acyltransferase [Borealophlyctis nickersoniae]
MALPPFDRMPSRVVPTLKTLASAVVSLALFVGFGNKWYYQLTLEPGYLELPFWHRFMYLQLAGGIARTKYYVAWKLAESACILAGVGWNGYDRKTGKPRWDRVQNIAIRGFELAENPKMMIDSWNKNTGAWLRNCVYLRITPPGAKSTTWAAIATYITSAFWHGFWPGYYLTFLTGSIINVVGRELRRNLRPLFVSPSKLSNLKPIYDVLAWALTIAVINYTVGPFMLQTLDKSLTMMKRNYFIGHVGLFVIMVGFKVLGWGKLTRKVGAAVGADFGAKRKAMNGDVVSEAVEVTAPILATDAGVKEE